MLFFIVNQNHGAVGHLITNSDVQDRLVHKAEGVAEVLGFPDAA